MESNNERRNLDKLQINLRMMGEFDFPKGLLPPEEMVDKHLGTVERLLGILETGPHDDADALTEGQELLALFDSKRPEVQQWCTVVLDSRFQQHVSVPYHVSIRTLCERGPIQQVNSVEVRNELAEQYGFRFEQFAKLLRMTGFLERLGIPEDFSLDHPQFLMLLNVLNGSADIDYEALFPELEADFNELKRHKYHMDEQSIIDYEQKGVSPLSVPDVLSLLTVSRLNEALDSDTQNRVGQLNNLILDTDVPNDERIKMYCELKDIYDNGPVALNFKQLVDSAAESLRLPEDHEGRCDSIEQLQTDWDTVDVVIPLASSDDGRNPLLARAIMKHFPHAFAMPTGGHQPHFTELAHPDRPHFTESDEMVAALLANNYQYPYTFPDLPAVEDAPALHLYDILAPDDKAVSTVENAQNTTKRLQILQEIQGGRPLNVVIVTTDLHCARAWASFRKSLPQEVVGGLKVLEYKGAPPLSDIADQRKIHGLIYMFSEYIKRTYMVSISS